MAMNDLLNRLEALSSELRLYCLSDLPGHLAALGSEEKLSSLLLDFNFIQAKLQAVGIFSLLYDYELNISPSDHQDEPLRGEKSRGLTLVHRALRASAHALQSDPFELPAQILGRLGHSKEPSIDALLSAARSYRRKAWLRPYTPTLTPAPSALVATLIGHRGPVTAVAMVGEDRVITASRDGTLKVWEGESGEQVGELALAKGDIPYRNPHLALSTVQGKIGAMVISEDKSRGLLYHDGLYLRIVDPMGGLNSKALPYSFKRFISSITVSPDGALGAVAAGDRICVFDLHNNRAVATWRVSGCERVGPMKISPDKESILIGISGFEFAARRGLLVCHLWSGRELLLLKSRAFGSHTGNYKTLYSSIASLDISSDGSKVVGVSDDAILRLWSLPDGREVMAIDAGSEYHSRYGTSAEYGDLFSRTPSLVALLRDGAYAIWILNKRITVWDLNTARRLNDLGFHTERINALDVSGDGRYLTTASEDHTARLWSLDGVEYEAPNSSLKRDVTHLAAVAGGTRAVIATASGEVKVLDSFGGQEPWLLAQHRHCPVVALHITSDERMVISASAHELMLWDIRGAQPVHAWKSELNVVTSFVVNSDWSWAASTGQGAAGNDALILWDLKNKESHVIHSSHMHVIAISQDGGTVFVAGLDGIEVGAIKQRRRIRELFDGQEVCSWRELNIVRKLGPENASFISINSDLSKAYFSSDNGSLIILSVRDGREIRRLKCTPSRISVVVESPDGELILCGHVDGTIDVLRTRDGLSHTLAGHSRAVLSISVESGWRYAASGSLDRFVILWDLTTFMAVAKFRADGEILRCEISRDGRDIIALDRSGQVSSLQLIPAVE